VAMVAALALAGCNRAAPTGQTVATVDGESITSSELKLELAGVPAKFQKQAEPLALENLVQRKLLVQYAKKQGFDRSADYVVQLRQAGDMLLARRALQSTVSAARQPISAADVNEYLNGHPDITSNRRLLLVDQLQFPAPSAQIMNELKPTMSLAAVVAVLQQHHIQPQHAQTQLDTATLPDEVNAKIDGLKPGEPLISVNGANAIASAVVQTKAAPLEGDQAEAVARRRMQEAQAQAAIKQRQSVLRADAKIDYADGFKAPVQPKP
jgi:EpsD family peptidyl-prolyl cis-trans isomerase